MDMAFTKVMAAREATGRQGTGTRGFGLAKVALPLPPCLRGEYVQ